MKFSFMPIYDKNLGVSSHIRERHTIFFWTLQKATSATEREKIICERNIKHKAHFCHSKLFSLSLTKFCFCFECDAFHINGDKKIKYTFFVCLFFVECCYFFFGCVLGTWNEKSSLIRRGVSEKKYFSFLAVIEEKREIWRRRW
jgi:hypothetical protein